MPIKQHVDAKTLGKRFAELVRQRDLPVQSIWVRQRHEVSEVWIITQSLELEQLRPVYEARVALRKSFPDAEFEVHTLNPAWISHLMAEDQVPQEATRIELGG